MVKPPFLNNEIYHIYNRGVEKRDIFMNDMDYLQFIHYLFYLNDSKNLKNLSRRTSLPMSEVQPHSLEIRDKHTRKLLVEILAFTLMPNHYHIVLSQKTDGGIVKFMQKLGTGYTMFFNEKYDRVGPLFQGRFKAALVKKDGHFLYLPHYIHLNPLDLLNKRDSIPFIEKRKFLENYKWSSFPDYIGKKNFPSVTQRDFILKNFGGVEKYKQDIEGFIKQNRLGKDQIENTFLID